MPRRGTSKKVTAPAPPCPTGPFGRSQTLKDKRLRQPAVGTLRLFGLGGLARTSLFEVCDAPEGHFEEGHSARTSLPHGSLREIADVKRQTSAPARRWDSAAFRIGILA
jgi:hypothetical protein